MTHRLLIFGLFLMTCTCKSAERKSDKNIEVVNPDYEILSVADKTRDGSRPLGWRCFPIKDVQVKYRTWPDTDPMDSHKIIDIMCDFEMFAKNKLVSNHYSGRRGKPESYCNDFKAAWKKLTRGEEHVCIDGESWSQFTPEEDTALKKLKMSWTWDKIKTQKGCYSFWDGYQCADLKAD